MKNTLLASCIVLFFLGCSETVTVIEEVPFEVVPTYEELSRSRDPYKTVYQMVGFDDRLVLQSNLVHHVYHMDGRDFTFINGRETRYRETMNDDFIVTIRGERLVVQYADRNRSFSSNILYIGLDSILPAGYTLHDESVSIFNRIGGLNNDNILLLPYYNSEEQLAFVLLELSESANTPGLINYSVAGSGVYTGDVELNIRGFTIHGIPGGFLLDQQSRDGNVILKIQNDGTTDLVHRRDLRAANNGFFELNDVLYTWGRSLPNLNIVLHASTDNG